MTILLSIETATDACSVALQVGTHPIVERFEICPMKHTHRVLPMVEALLREENLALADLEAIAFGAGPGSFTGLRIAASVAQALGFGLQKPVVPISTLRAIAQAAFQLQGHRRVVAVLDARMAEVYWGAFAVNDEGIMEAVQPEQVTTLAAVTPPAPIQDWTIVTDERPHARWIAMLGVYEHEKGRSVPAEKAQPQYVRHSVVQGKFKKDGHTP